MIAKAPKCIEFFVNYSITVCAIVSGQDLSIGMLCKGRNSNEVVLAPDPPRGDFLRNQRFFDPQSSLHYASLKVSGTNISSYIVSE